MADLSRERERETEIQSEIREELHVSAHPSSPELGLGQGRAGLGRAGLGLGCAILNPMNLSLKLDFHRKRNHEP